VVAAICLLAEVLVFKSMGPGCVVSLPTSIELVELMQCVGRRMEEGFKEVFGILVIRGEDRIGREWSEGDVDDSRVGRWGFLSDRSRPFIL